MKPGTLTASVVIITALIPAAVAGQNWTDEEQGLLDAIMSCWQSFETDRSMEGFQAACGVTEETVYWYTVETSPFSVLSDWVEDVRSDRGETIVAQDLRPIRIRIEDGFGFVWFHGIRVWRDENGERVPESWRGFEVWKQSSDGWSFNGGMGAPDIEGN